MHGMQNRNGYAYAVRMLVCELECGWRVGCVWQQQGRRAVLQVPCMYVWSVCFVNIGEIVNSIIVIMTHDTDGAAPPAPPPPPAGAAGAFAAAAAGYAADAVVTAACAATDFFRSFLCGIFLPMLAIFVCVSMWLLRFVLCANCFVQSLNGQTNGLSPVCVRTCVRRLKSSENRLPQPS